jgi:hypothetical protein
MADLKIFQSLSAADQEKIMESVEVLCENNKNIVTQMIRLADIKKNQPIIWNMAILKLKA